MKIFLIILGIYLISIVLCHIIAYLFWISDKDSYGDTFEDLYNYAQVYDTIICLSCSWIPVWNTILVFLLLFTFTAIKLSDLKIR